MEEKNDGVKAGKHKCAYLGCNKEAIGKGGIYGNYYCEEHLAIAREHAEEHIRRNLYPFIQ